MKKEKLFLAGMFSIALTFGLLFTSCGDLEEGNTTPDNPDTGGNSAKSISVYMEKPADWTKLYAYVWDDGGTEYNGAAPGAELTNSASGFYSFKATAEYGYFNVRYSDGANNSSLDIMDIEQDTYYKADGTLPGDASKVKLAAGTTSAVSTPGTLRETHTSTTATLTWDLVPGADGYVMYDQWYVGQPNEFWHLQRILPREQTSFFDNNYGAFLEPHRAEYDNWEDYHWKIVAVKFNDGFDISAIPALEAEDVDETVFSSNYKILHDFGGISVDTNAPSLDAPTNVQAQAANDDESGEPSVTLTWNEVPGADHYIVWWRDPDPDIVHEEDRWLYIGVIYGTTYVDADPEFIKPRSTYQYKVEARGADSADTGPVYGKWSDTVSTTTPAAETRSIALRSVTSRAAAKQQIPTPTGVTLDGSIPEVVIVTVTGTSGKYRTFEVEALDSRGNRLGSIIKIKGPKAVMSGKVKVGTGVGGSRVTIKIREIPCTEMSSPYRTSQWTASQWGELGVVSFPTLNVIGKVTSTTGTGKNTVKNVTLIVTGLPTVATPSYTVTSDTKVTVDPAGGWNAANDTFTGTIKTTKTGKITVAVKIGDVTKTYPTAKL